MSAARKGARLIPSDKTGLIKGITGPRSLPDPNGSGKGKGRGIGDVWRASDANRQTLIIVY